MTLVPFTKCYTPTYSAGRDDFDRVFDNFFKNALTNISTTAPSIGDLALRLDVSETEKAYVVKTELPGVEEKNIELTLEDGLLTISGQKEHETEEEGKTFHRVERSYGSFKRSLELPSDANEDKIKAHMKHGVLEIEIAKTKEAQKEAKRINIKSS